MNFKKIKEKIKTYNISFSIGLLCLFSIFMLALGLRIEDTKQDIPWWFALLYGWTGLTVSLKLSKIWDEKDK